MQKLVVLVHITKFLIEPMEELFAEIAPETRIIHLLDEGVLQISLKTGSINPKIVRRVCNLAIAAEEAGADVILLTDSASSLAVDVARKLISVPIVKINEPMIEAAVERGRTIGIMATDRATLSPSSSLVEEIAKKKHKDVTVRTLLCEGALQARLTGDIARHDQLLLQTLEDFSRSVDIIVLAQASMVTIAPQAQGRVGIPILSSPKMAIEKVKQILRTGE